MEMLLPSISLLIVTVFASYIYYKKILEAQGEYIRAKNVIQDITFGFTRQIKRVSKKILNIENNVQDAYIMSTEALKSSDKTLKIVENIQIIPDDLAEKFGFQQNELNDHRNLLDKQSEVLLSYDKEFKMLREEIKTIASKPQIRQVIREVDAAIPVDESDVLAQLTGTEIQVLKLMQNMGFSSVPQIKDKISKTREHTARLLKKLFEKGFIDRNTSSMPYRYQVRKEVKELINDQIDVST